MLGSMYSAVSGLAAHQTKMDVIGNNIANVNTYGFKSSRVTFSDVFYQTINGASGPTRDAGGMNPAQLGYGAKVKSIDVINTRAGSATTDRPLDIYINGDGYLPVKDNNGIIKYSRVGILSFDVAGNLVDSSGNMVLGIPLDSATKKPKLGADGNVGVQELVPIHVAPEDLSKYTGIAIGSNGEITAIKEGDPVLVPAANTPWLVNTEISPNSLYRGGLTLTAVRGDGVSFLPASYEGGKGVAGSAVEIGPNANINGALKLSYDSVGDIYTLTYKKIGSDADKTVTGTLDPLSEKVTFEIDPENPDSHVTISVGTDEETDIVVAPDQAPITIGHALASTVTISGVTYDKSGAEVILNARWEAGAADNSKIKLGDMTFTIDPARFGSIANNELNKTLVGNVGPGSGEPTIIANIATVSFLNSDGLSQTGEGYFVETVNSGKPVGTIPGNSGTGTLRSGAVEMSNVDLSREFTEMIIAQRGFQANTRMITVSDEMLSELVNMKR